jgi:predicted nucleic acid-binding Zn ribbon protein
MKSCYRTQGLLITSVAADTGAHGGRADVNGKITRKPLTRARNGNGWCRRLINNAGFAYRGETVIDVGAMRACSTPTCSVSSTSRTASSR